MVEHSKNVTEELEKSGLLDLMYPQYRMLLTCMAKMADAQAVESFRQRMPRSKRSGGYDFT